MSETVRIAIVLWFRAILMVAVFLALLFGFNEGVYSILFVLVVALIAGMTITVPLLLLIIPIVRFSIFLPYKRNVCQSSMAFLLASLALLFLYVIYWYFDMGGNVFSDKEFVFSVLLAVVLSTYSITPTYKQLKNESHEHDLV